MFRLLSIAFLVSLLTGLNPAIAQGPVPASTQAPPAVARPARPTPPTRDPNTPGYVTAKELPDGANPSPTADGNSSSAPRTTRRRR